MIELQMKGPVNNTGLLVNYFFIVCQALSVCGDHVSLYQLTLERGTPLFKSVKSGKLVRGLQIIINVTEN